jgi:hypothetical protein
MIKRIKEWFGFGTNWKSLLIRSQEAILESVVKLNSLIFLRPDEIETYTSPMKFLHDASAFADETVVIHKGDELIIKGLCIGYGTLINNVVECDGFGSHVVSNIKKFYVVQTNEDKIITLEEGMTINYAEYTGN